jgi:hypothetical protein
MKSSLKGKRFKDTVDIQKMWWHWKLFYKSSSKNVSNSGSIVALSA